MFGNRMVYYGGSGGIRRGLIWQNGDLEPEWKEPEKEWDRGNLDPGKLWGSFVYGGIVAIRRITADREPVTNTWTHDPGASTIWYSKNKKVIKFDYEWDSLQGTPQNLQGASAWFTAPDHQQTSTYTGTVFWTDIKFNPFSRQSLPRYDNHITLNRYSDGTSGGVYNFNLAWNGDSWSNAGYPFADMFTWATHLMTNDFNGWSYNLGSRCFIQSIDLWNVSEAFLLLDTSNPVNSYPFRSVGNCVINAYNDSYSTSVPSYIKGAWTITLKNAVFPDFAFTNLHNT